MTITLRQESQAGTTTKGSSLTYAELDNNFIDILTNKILPLQVNADTGVVTVGQAQQNGVFNITGSTGLSTTVTEDSAGNANLTISLDQVSGTNLNVTIYAKATESISAGDVVMFAGVQGDHLQVKKAVIDDSAGVFISEYIVGVAQSALATNDFGYIVTQGQITDPSLNLSAFSVGDILWFDPTTAGGLTATEPSAPNPKVRVAAVLRNNGSDDIMLVRPTFSRRLQDVEDVSTTDASNNDYLIYNSGTGVWQPQALDISTDTTPTLGGALDANSNNFTNVGTINSHTIPAGTGTFALTSDIVDTQIVAGTGIQVTQTDSAGAYTITNTVTAGDTVQEGDNIEITSPDSAGGKTIAFRNPLNQPVVGGDQTFRQINLEDYSETIYTGGTATGTITPDVANGNVQRIQLTGNITFNAFNSPAAGQSMTLIIQQPSSGGPYTLSSTMKFAGGTKTLSTTADAYDIMSVFYDGTNYFASLSTNFS